MGYCRSGHVEGAAQVDRHHATPGLWRVLPETGGVVSHSTEPGVDAGVVYQDVQPAQLSDGCIHRILTRLRVGDIGNDADGAAAPANLSDLVDALVQPFPIYVGQRDPGAGPRQSQRHSVSNPDGTSSAGYYRYLPV